MGLCFVVGMSVYICKASNFMANKVCVAHITTLVR
jgi:hypothetical protein